MFTNTRSTPRRCASPRRRPKARPRPRPNEPMAAAPCGRRGRGLNSSRAKMAAVAAGGEVHGAGFSVLAARAGDVTADLLTQALRAAGARDVRSVEIGSHAPRFELGR